MLFAGDRLSRDFEHHSSNRGHGDAEGTQANSPSTETEARKPRGRGSASNGGRKCSCRVWQRLARRRSHERVNGEVQQLRKHHADLGDGSQTAERLRLATITTAALLVFSARSEGEIEPRIWPHGFNIREIGEHGERLGVLQRFGCSWQGNPGQIGIEARFPSNSARVALGKKNRALPRGPVSSAGGKRGRACCSGVRASAKQGEKGDQGARACGVATGPQAGLS